MSVESSASRAGASGPTHDGPLYPWETAIASADGPVSRSELARQLVDAGVQPAEPAAVDMVDAAIARGELSFDGQFVHPPSRQSNLNKCVNDATTEKQPSESGENGTPTVEEKVAEFATEYPNLTTLPLAKQEGVSIRRDYARVEMEAWEADQPDMPELSHVRPATGVTEVATWAMEWGEAVGELLTSYEMTKNTMVNFRKGQPGGVEFEEWSKSAKNRWFASYQKKYAAQLDAWLRELCGGERPSGNVTEASFENPHVALCTRSASSVPNGERVGPIDHGTVVRNSWRPVYDTLRNTLRAAGYELGEDWQYSRHLEPHRGERGDRGTNECYTHEHIVIVVDGNISSEDLQPVIDKHVEECEWAGADAHDDGAIEVREPSELNDVAAYVADYCSIDPVGLLERSPAYVGWAAAMTAGNIRTVSRSEAARDAAAADACKQRVESAKAEQEEGHGESVRRQDGEIVCEHCQSAHGIDQQRTLTAHRAAIVAVADGGNEVTGREAELRERWGGGTWTDAFGNERTAEGVDAVASVGESPTRRRWRKQIKRELRQSPDVPPPAILGRAGLPPEAVGVVEEIRAGIDREEAVGFDDSVPEWRVHSVTVDGEEHLASAGNGVEMVEIGAPRVDGLPSSVGVRGKGDGVWYECLCGFTASSAAMIQYAHTGHRGGNGSCPYRGGESGDGKLDQQSRREAVLEAAGGGGTDLDELAARIGVDEGQIEHDVAKLCERGQVYEDASGRLRRA